MKAKTIALGFRPKMREMPRNATGLLGMEKGEEAARRARRMRSERIKETGDWQGYGRGEGDTHSHSGDGGRKAAKRMRTSTEQSMSMGMSMELGMGDAIQRTERSNDFWKNA